MSWIVLLDPPADGAHNMALDAALLEAADTGGLRVLRLYAWDPPRALLRPQRAGYPAL